MTTVKKILLVDDDAAMRQMVKTILTLNDFDVCCAGDGASALRLLKAGSFDVVISDFFMPGIKGSELVQIARDNYPQSFIIGISGDNVGEDFLKAGADTFLKKPFAPDDLLSFIIS